MTTLFKHVLEGLEENCKMNNLTSLFEGFDTVQDAIDLYGSTFNGDCDAGELSASITALAEIQKSGNKGIEQKETQAAIKKWNEVVWGQDFGTNDLSIPFSG